MSPLNVDVAFVDVAFMKPTVGEDVAPTVVAPVQYVSQFVVPPDKDAPPVVVVATIFPVASVDRIFELRPVRYVSPETVRFVVEAFVKEPFVPDIVVPEIDGAYIDESATK